MRTALHVAAALPLCFCVASPAQGQPGAQPAGLQPAGAAASAPQAPGGQLSAALAGVQWASRPVTFEQLEGKTVVLLVYASWCPKCNAWSGALFAQLREAIRGKPVVVLSIYADEDPRAALPYLKERGFFAPNILHGYDPAMPAKLGFQGNLYHYAMIGPGGKLVERGKAGSFFRRADGNQFSLPVKLAASGTLGEFKFITPEMSEEVQALFWPCELGGVSERELEAGRRNLPAEQKKQVDAAVDRYLTGQIVRIRDLYKGTVPERVEALEIAERLSGMFRSTPQSKKAQEVVGYFQNDPELKLELAAKKLYDSILEGATENATRRRILLRTVTTRFKDTYYGQLAAAALETDRGK